LEERVPYTIDLTPKNIIKYSSLCISYKWTYKAREEVPWWFRY